MSTENTVDKVRLISELKEIHSELFQVYKKLFDFKYKHDEEFKLFIDKEHEENGVGSKEIKAWNDNFCHRASYTLLNKILFVRICEDKGFMRNAEDYIVGEVKDPHIGEKLSKVGLQKWGRLITNHTLGELIKFAFSDMKQSYSNIVLYKEDKYEILNPRSEECNLKYIDGDKETKDLVLAFENVLNNIIEKLDTNNFNFKYTDGNILGDVYEKFMDRETRKAIGQFYTPEFVIEYILRNTVEKADVVEKPFVTVADISCGSGHFLIMAYDILREKFLSNIETLKEKYVEEIYTIKKNGKEEQLTGREYWVKEHVHYHILKHCLYGADIDSFAVQLTTINLLLKDLDNFADELNIVECDSLIKWEVDYEWEELKEQLGEEFETVVTTQINLFGEEEKFEEIVRKENYKLYYKDMSGIKREELINFEKAEEIINICEFWSNNFDYVVGNPPYLVLIKSKYDNKKLEYFKRVYRTSEYNPNLYALFMERVIDILNYESYISFITPDTWLKNQYFKNLRKIYTNELLIDLITTTKDETFEEAIVQTLIFICKKNNKEDINENIIKIFKEVSEKSEKGIYVKEILQKNLTNQYNDGFDLWSNDIENQILNLICNNSFELKKECFSYRGLEPRNNENSLFKYKKDENFMLLLRGKDVNRYYKQNADWYVNFVIEDMKSNADLSKYKVKEKLLMRVTGSDLTVAYDCNQLLALKSLYLILPRQESNINLKYVLANLNSDLENYFFKKVFLKNKNLFPSIKAIELDKLRILKSKNVEQIENIVDELIELIEKNNKLRISDFLNENDLFNEYLKYNRQYYKNIIRICELEHKINKFIFNSYGFTDEQIIYILKFLGNVTNEKIKYYSVDNNKSFINVFDEFVERLSKNLTVDEFLVEYEKEDKSIEKLSKKYNSDMITVLLLREKYISECNNENLCKLYNSDKLYMGIFDYLKQETSNNLKENEGYFSIKKITDMHKLNIFNFNAIIEVIRINNPTQKSTDIVKEALNADSYTWNAYRKDKEKNKISKTFVKYYDSKYYGLTEWSDEIHKQYFMDAIDEYTVNSPNEKKAKDILNLFKELDIEDKEDYVDIIEDKIKKAFS